MTKTTFRFVRPRTGFTSTELVVACSLLVVVMSVIGPVAVRTGRLWQDSRHQQLALVELSSEIERLTALDATARAAAMQSLSPSQSLALAAPNAAIEAETLSDDDGTRIVLTLNWNESDYPRSPVRLVGWLNPLPTEQTP